MSRRARVLRLFGLRLALVLALVAIVSSPRAAHAQDRRIETSAKEALKRARADFSAADFDGALARLLKALRACGTIRCSAPTRAALHRDVGVMQLRRGQAGKAGASFAEALRVDRRIELVAPYNVPDVRAEWDAALDEAGVVVAPQPSGDFTHTPVPEQVPHTPVPVYVEYSGTDAVASVVAKYQGPAAPDWKRLSLTRMGAGWGGLIPCADVARGVLRYYIQGFDARGTPSAMSGDPKHPFHVAIRQALVGQPPSLPGQAPPATCTGAEPAATPGETPPPPEAAPAPCEDDSQCNGAACQQGKCVEPAHLDEARRDFARLWVGVSASLDLTLLSSSSDVCALTPSALPFNSRGYYCTNPDGTDYPTRANTTQNDLLTPGNAGQVNGAPAVGNVRLLLTFDFAITRNILVGARFGYVGHGYTGSQASRDGRGLGLPLHFEARGSYLFGKDALAREGFAPLVFVDGGAAEVDAPQTVTVVETGVPGTLPKKAWRIGGPGFIGAGVGVRYAFSQRIAMTGALKVAAAFGGAGLFTTFGPEMALQYGF